MTHSLSVDYFAELRHLQNSKLPNHKLTLSILKAAEDTLSIRGLSLSADNYFDALWPLLFHRPVREGNDQLEEWTGSVLSLSARILPFLTVFSKERWTQLYSGLDQSASELFNQSASCARAVISCTAAITSFYGDSQSRTDLMRKVLVFPLLDARPKVRKEAQDAFLKCIEHVPPLLVDEFMKMAVIGLQEASRRECQAALHIIPLLSRIIDRYSDASRLNEVLQAVDYCLGLGNNFLSIQCFQLAEKLKMDAVHQVLMKHRPKADELYVHWLIPFAASASDISSALEIVFDVIQSDRPDILKSGKVAVQTLLSKQSNGAVDFDRLAASLNSKINVKRFEESFHPATLDICRLTFEAFKSNLLPAFSSTIQLLYFLHGRKGFTMQSYVEDILADVCKYIHVGPFLDLIPLNLCEEGKKNGWLIAVINLGCQNDQVATFKSKIMTEQIPLLTAKMTACKGEMDKKIYETVVFQLWACLAKFISTCPTDLIECFDDSLAGQCAALMNSNLALRPLFCNALSDLIDNLQNEDMEMANVNREECLKMLAGTKAPKFLPVLFNLCLSDDPQAYMLRCIQCMLSICASGQGDIYLRQIVDRLQVMSADDKHVSILLDIAGAILSSSEVNEQIIHALLAIAKNGIMSQQSHIQKHSYRIISIVAIREDRLSIILTNEMIQALIESVITCDPSARKARFKVLSLLNVADEERLAVLLPAILPEVILGTKEVNERARSVAFDLIIKWGRQMHMIGRLPDYFDMTMAGLAARTPTMMAATLMALARLAFDFNNEISEKLSTLLDDCIAILSSPTKEVVKAAIGFIKVCVLSKYNRQMIDGKLDKLLTGLLVWAGEHTQHFKLRVRHIIERLIRIYGYEHIYAVCPPEHYALLENIKLIKDRKNKRKRNYQEKHGVQGMDDGTHVKKPFDQAMFEDLSGDDFDGEECLAEDDMEVVDDRLDDVLSKKLSLKHSMKSMKSVKSMKSAKCVNSKNSAKSISFNLNDDFEFKRSKSGKIIIDDEKSVDDIDAIINVPEVHDNAAFFKKSKRQRSTNDEEMEDPEESHDEHHHSTFTSLSKKTGLTARSSIKSFKSSLSSTRKQLKTDKKKRGDSLKPGKLEPYAYVPLQRKRGSARPNYFMKKK